MLRDPNLIPLSHQHQHALALCVRIERASPVGDADLDAWQSEVALQFRNEIAVHFAAEEQVVFSAAVRFKELAGLVGDLLAEHVQLRALFARAQERKLSSAELLALAQRLSTHIRKEERQLFEMLQQLLPAEQLNELGTRLDFALKDAASTCGIPNETTRLRPSKDNSRR
jgi:hemerythrin-like domain-containing protein